MFTLQAILKSISFKIQNHIYPISGIDHKGSVSTEHLFSSKAVYLLPSHCFSNMLENAFGFLRTSFDKIITNNILRIYYFSLTVLYIMA